MFRWCNGFPCEQRENWGGVVDRGTGVFRPLVKQEKPTLQRLERGALGVQTKVAECCDGIWGKEGDP